MLSEIQKTPLPKIMDLSWGFQSYLSAGACSKARLDRSISDNKNSW